MHHIFSGFISMLLFYLHWQPYTLPPPTILHFTIFSMPLTTCPCQRDVGGAAIKSSNNPHGVNLLIEGDYSHIETRLECISLRTSCCTLHFVDLHHLRRYLLPSSPLAIISLCAVHSVNCSCVHPTLCISSFWDCSNHSSSDPCSHSLHQYLTCACALPWRFALWPYLCMLLSNHDGIVKLDFADTSTVSDVNTFECWQLNGRNSAIRMQTLWLTLPKALPGSVLLVRL